MSLSFLLLLAAAGCSAPQRWIGDGRAAPKLTAEERQLNVQSFDYVWTTIRDRHFDPRLGGLNWEAVRDELRPRVEQAATMPEARSVMSDMIGRLGQSHFRIIPAQSYEKLAAAGELAGAQGPSAPGAGEANEAQSAEATASKGSTGIDVRVIDGAALVTSVAPESPAAQAGVRPGWEIVAIARKKLRAGELVAAAGDQPMKRALATLAIQKRISGTVGQIVEITFRDGAGRLRRLDIPLAPERGHAFKMGHVPEVHVWFETRPLAGDIGYIAFNGFWDPVRIMEAYAQAMERFMNARGIIIDLRGNFGGIGAMAMGMAGWLIAEKHHHLGTMTLRDFEMKFAVNPRPATFNGPVAVLVDGLSASTSEILAGGLQDLGRARVFGTTTAGAALPSNIERLPNGDGFQYAFANYVSASGVQLEGRGVIPDVIVEHNRAALLQGRDAAIDAAIDWIDSIPLLPTP